MVISETESTVAGPEPRRPTEGMARRERAREVQAAIADVLLREWDPIGVSDEPACRDEYDFYVGGVYRVLASGASPEKVAEHLWSLEKEEMGLRRPGPEALLHVAEKLCALNIQMSPK